MPGESNGSTKPAAYLNYIVFDKNIDYSYITTVDANQGVMQQFTLNTIPTFTQPGYVYVYLSNESSATDKLILFDELNIRLTRPIEQVQDYYPFGLTLAGTSYQRLGSQENKFLYNGKELQTDLDLNWYDYGARMYDPAIGRFPTQDRYTGKYMDMTPYQYGANNPIRFIDVNGDSLWISFGQENQNRVLYQDGQLLNSDGSQYIGEGVKITKKGKQRITNSFLRSATSGLSSIAKYESKSGTSVLSTLQGSDNNFTIAQGSAHFDPGTFNQPYLFANQATSNMVNETGLSMLPFWESGGFNYSPLPANQSGSGGIIYFSGNSNNGTVLGHELFHAYDANTGNLIINPIPDSRTHINGTVIREIRAATFENGIRSRFGIPLRETYNNGGHRLIDPKGNPITMPPAEIIK